MFKLFGPAKARIRVVVASLVDILFAVAAVMLGPWQLAPLLGWGAGALVYGVWIWATIWKLDANQTAAQAVREDPARAASDVVLLLTAIASLGAVGIVIVYASTTTGILMLASVILGVMSVVLSWAIVHTIYTLKYAHMYYGEKDGGVEFNSKQAPTFQDFAYLAFTIGMTYQVSDTPFTTREFRATALKQGLLSYLFGTMIEATTINLVAGLSK